MHHSFKILLMTIFVFYIGCKTDQIFLQGEIHHPKTSDNWDLTLERFSPYVGTPVRKYPVIICHGIIGSRNYFKIREGKSIVAGLQSEGYEVWLLDLRAREDGTKASLYFSKSDVYKEFKFSNLIKSEWWFGKKRYNDFSFDEYATKDLDAAIDYVIEKTGTPKVNWIGHSMGGMVALTKIGSYSEDRIANLVTIGTPYTFLKEIETTKVSRASTFNFFSWLSPVIPTGTASKANAYFWIPVPFLGLFTYNANVYKDDETRLKKYATNNESPKVVRQFSDAMKDSALKSFNKSINYSSNLSNVTIPSFFIAGRRDHIASASNVRDVYDRIGSTDKEMLVAGRSEGHEEDYGHVDLIIGRNVDKDINKPITNWLNKRN
jgi:pimeloyl-ACP methyl ester carboxylesterase